MLSSIRSRNELPQSQTYNPMPRMARVPRRKNAAGKTALPYAPRLLGGPDLHQSNTRVNSPASLQWVSHTQKAGYPGVRVRLDIGRIR